MGPSLAHRHDARVQGVWFSATPEINCGMGETRGKTESDANEGSLSCALRRMRGRVASSIHPSLSSALASPCGKFYAPGWPGPRVWPLRRYKGRLSLLLRIKRRWDVESPSPFLFRSEILWD